MAAVDGLVSEATKFLTLRNGPEFVAREPCRMG